MSVLVCSLVAIGFLQTLVLTHITPASTVSVLQLNQGRAKVVVIAKVMKES